MPAGIGIDKFMNTYIADMHHHRVLKFPQRLNIGEVKGPKNAMFYSAILIYSQR
jgi:hypothetical protein